MNSLLFLGCSTALPAKRFAWILSPLKLPNGGTEKSDPADEIRGPSRADSPKQSKMEHLLVPDNTSGGTECIPSWPGRIYIQQGEVLDIHAFNTC